ncbi:hypothetical protein, partial [Burkholderia cenocepacia]|uniref:hypothetical protein n=1 Tax=Burkholderia cenocepacia TaxID=95486 RepID=UPI002AB7001C
NRQAASCPRVNRGSTPTEPAARLRIIATSNDAQQRRRDRCRFGRKAYSHSIINNPKKPLVFNTLEKNHNAIPSKMPCRTLKLNQDSTSRCDIGIRH